MESHLRSFTYATLQVYIIIIFITIITSANFVRKGHITGSFCVLWAYQQEESISLTFGGDAVTDTDSTPLFHFPHHSAAVLQ